VQHSSAGSLVSLASPAYEDFHHGLYLFEITQPPIFSTRASPIAAASGLDELIMHRVEFLAAYQNTAYADRYRARIAKLRAVEWRAAPGSTEVTETAARTLFKLMAVKDEYEVARLYTEGSFQRQLSEEFESFDRLEFHLAPPILVPRDKTGRPRKARFGQWALRMFAVLSRLRGLRGSLLDPFAYTAEKRLNRQLLAQYEADLNRIERLMIAGELSGARRLAAVPAQIRGFGHVRAAAAGRAASERARLLAELAGHGRSESTRAIEASSVGSAQGDSVRRPAA